MFIFDLHKCMCWLVIASQIAAVSAVSFLPFVPLKRYAMTNFGGDQPDGVTDLPEKPCPMVGTGESFHADQAWRQSGNQVQQLIAWDFEVDEFNLACVVSTLNGKNVLG